MRISLKITIFLVLLNASAGLVTQMGVAGEMGVNPNPGGDERITEANETAGSVSASQSSEGQTLFGVFTSLGGLFGTIFSLVFAGPTMLANIGIPGPFVTFLFAPAYFLVAADIAYILSGRFI